MAPTDEPRVALTARLAELKAKRRTTRRNARWAGTVAARQLGRQLSEEAAESLADKLPLGLGLAASAGFAASDWRKARRAAAIAADPSQPEDIRERAALEAKIYRRAAALEAASGTAAVVPGVGTAAAVGTDAVAISLETRDRVRLEELGGSVLEAADTDEPKQGVSQSLKRSLDKNDAVIRRVRASEESPASAERDAPAKRGRARS